MKFELGYLKQAFYFLHISISCWVNGILDYMGSGSTIYTPVLLKCLTVTFDLDSEIFLTGNQSSSVVGRRKKDFKNTGRLFFKSNKVLHIKVVVSIDYWT